MEEIAVKELEINTKLYIIAQNVDAKKSMMVENKIKKIY